RDYRIIINSNGTLLKPALADYFALYRERISFGISLDGPKEFHDKFRRKEGAFARAMSAITLLGKKGLSVEVNCTVFDENYGVCLELINLLRDTAASIRYTPYVAPSGGGRDLQEKNLDAASIQAIILTVSRLRRQGYPVFVNAPLALLDPKDALIIECGWGQSLCGINAWGDVCMCPVTSEPSLIAGNIRAHSLESIWTNATLFRQLRNVSVEDIEGVCSICVIRQYCRGGCRLNGYLLTGRLTAPNIICQKLYDAGYFPAYAVEQPTRVAMSG
ncbi:MAG: radical SAM protein, partial [Desulforhabdus sp.]|nr:radical SAM protein [Desulforhabdus sp.]